MAGHEDAKFTSIFIFIFPPPLQSISYVDIFVFANHAEKRREDKT